MKFRRLYQFFLGLLIGLLTQAQAAEWRLDTVDSVPGAGVEMTLSLTGDGVTNASVVEIYFDEARLQLPVRRGEIPGASRNGALCSRNADNRIDVFQFDDSRPLLAGTNPVCVLPFKVPSNAPNGSAGLEIANAECSGRGQPQICTIKLRRMRVIAPVQPPSPGVAIDPVLYVLLSPDRLAPTVEALVSFKLSSLPNAEPPIQALRVGKPQFVFPFDPFRARGDFKAYIDADPTSPSAKLQRYAVIRYANAADRDLAKRAFEKERYVDYVYASVDRPQGGAARPASDPAAPELSQLGPVSIKSTAVRAKTPESTQTHWNLMNFPAAWALTGGGWGLVFAGDNGIELAHSALKSSALDGTPNAYHISGGNFIPGLSYDFGSQPGNAVNPVWKMVDEIQAVNDLEGSNDNDCGSPPYITQTAGHGTHVAGLIAGNALQTNSQIGGGCKHCGMAMLKISKYECQTIQPQPPVFRVQPVANSVGIETAMSLASRLGAQVYNMSFGFTGATALFCDPAQANDNHPSCIALSRAVRLQTLIAAASGNNRNTVQFVASEARAAAIGGTAISGQVIWDESPAGTPGCTAGQPCFHGCPAYVPFVDPSNQLECGSNWIPDGTNGLVEIATPAKSVNSLFYHGKTWSARSACGDGFPAGSSASDGVGLCTGTSMSAPLASALFGLLRSINPLVPVGDPDNGAIVPGHTHYGVRNVVAETASRANNRNDQLGYGLPNAHEAAKRLLGTVRAEPRTNPGHSAV